MKTKISKITAYLSMIGIGLMISQAVWSQEEFKKEFDKNYSCSKQTNFSISNKYGDIEIRDWEKNEIDIQAEIILRNVSKQKADQIFELVDINFSQSGNDILVETDYDEGFFKLVNQNMGKDKRFEVNYIVNMPSYIKSEIDNKYGSVFISKLTSASAVRVKYGNLKINRFEGQDKNQMADVELGYSTGTIETCQWLRISIKYSKINIINSKALILLSKYSKLNIEKGTSIVSESKYDSYEIGSLANMVTEAQYSNFKCDEISNKLKLNTKYTDVKVNYIPAGFESIEIDNSYGSINLRIDNGASYKLDGYAKYAKINYPSEGRVNRFQESSELRVEGIVGTESNNLPDVKINTNYGGINLVQ
jgi:hypothetical protein